MIQRSPRPVLAVPREATPLSKALLAYDGSPKSEEALFLACYMAGSWEIPLVVVTVQEHSEDAAAILRHCESYIDRCGIASTSVIRSGSVSRAILDTVDEHQCDFIIMGGYGMSAVREVVLGSTVDQVLRDSHLPIMICR
jgi:nucleotide-binding universal stress UspA family protein